MTDDDNPGSGRPARSPEEWHNHARTLSLRWLGARSHTRAELREKLTRKGIPETVANSVLERLVNAKLIDDAEFAATWVRSRHTHNGRGRKALAMELRRKGVSDPDAAQALSSITDDDERSRAYALTAQKLERSGRTNWADPAERQSATRKLVGMLARRGYAPSLAYSVVKQVVAESAGADIELPGEETSESDI